MSPTRLALERALRCGDDWTAFELAARLDPQGDAVTGRADPSGVTVYESASGPVSFSAKPQNSAKTGECEHFEKFAPGVRTEFGIAES